MKVSWKRNFEDVSRVFNDFQECFLILRGFPKCFKRVSRVFQGSFIHVSRKFEGSFKRVLRRFQGSFKGV